MEVGNDDDLILGWRGELMACGRPLRTGEWGYRVGDSAPLPEREGESGKSLQHMRSIAPGNQRNIL